MKIIDIHAHIYPDNIAQKAADSVKVFYEGIGDRSMNGTEGMLLERGDQAGIDRFVALPVAIRPDRVQGINDYIYQRAQANPRLIPFGTVHAAMDGLTDEVERLIAMGVKGIKMHPDSQQFAIDDPKCMPIYELCQQAGIALLLHTGDKRYDYSNPDHVEPVLKLFPRRMSM